MSQPLRALIVEDSEDDALLLVDELRRGGFETVFARVASREAMTAALAAEKWDVVFADSNMPHFRGTDALRILQDSGVDLPFIFVSGAIGEETAVVAMKAGADDYIMKRDLKRLLPAVERELREAEIRRQRKRVEQEVKRHQERIRALHDIDMAIISTLELSDVLAILLEKIDIFVSRSLASTVRLLNKDTGILELVASRNLDEEEWRSEGWKKERDLDCVVAEIGSPLIVDNLQSDLRTRDPQFFRKHGLVAYLGVPLIAKGKPLGVVSFYTNKEQKPSSEEIEFLVTLVGQAALAIYNAQLYKKTKKQAEALEEANRIKSEFLGVISHELKTPLNAVMGYAGMIRDKLLADQQRAVGKIMKHSADLLLMIDSMLDATRLEAGAVAVHKQPFSLKHFLEDLKSFYDVGVDKNVALVWDFPVESAIIRTDSAKLSHILQNLINNALKFTERGTVTVLADVLIELREEAEEQEIGDDSSAGRGSTASSPQYIEFKISDTGIGIPEEKLPVIFDMFRQVDSSSKSPHGGVGLGLYIVKTFVEMLGGTIAVESELGKGSTFAVTIPLEG